MSEVQIERNISKIAHLTEEQNEFSKPTQQNHKTGFQNEPSKADEKYHSERETNNEILQETISDGNVSDFTQKAENQNEISKDNTNESSVAKEDEVSISEKEYKICQFCQFGFVGKVGD